MSGINARSTAVGMNARSTAAGISLGVDIGSCSIKTVVLDQERRVLENRYTWCNGRPFDRLHEVLSDLLKRRPAAEFGMVAFTGSGGARAAELLGGHFVNEIVAQYSSAVALYPQARSIIEMGGEDSKLIVLSNSGGGKPAVAAARSTARLSDFAMNSMCAAGTGAFLDQQAKRIGVSIQKEFGELALKSEHPPRIAGRCSVFAKSDMIHLQQIATPVHDIVAGLCFAVARNFKSNLARGKEIVKPVVFQGGVAANAGMVRAFRELLSLGEEDLIIPAYHAAMGAIGAVYHVLDSKTLATTDGKAFLDLGRLESYLNGNRTEGKSLPPLRDTGVLLIKESDARLHEGERLPVSLGLDIGSLSTNVVLIDDNDRVVARRYLPTASRPLEAIRRGLREIAEEVGDRVEVRAVGATGSGRYLTADFVGGDLIQNEITAQATAAVAFDPTVDTIFEVGGQDSKFISLDRGVVVDFEMNKVCAAGTGSFLEEQAEKLGISIVNQFSSLALEADRPACLGDRCTVFMESDLISCQQKGASTETLVGGIAYSIVYNYIQKVVGTKRIGERVFFQGGVANNRAVISAFQAVTGRRITVPPHFDVTGAIGAAMLARSKMQETMAAGRAWRTRFKGFDISRVPYALGRFICTACSNQCEIRKVTVEGEKRPLFYGGRCEKWEMEDRKGRGKDIPNLFDERIRLLMGDFRDQDLSSSDAGARTGVASDAAGSRSVTIGIPRSLMVYYQQFPFWRTFFQELGFRVVLSRKTDRMTIQRSLEMLTTETCFPVEAVHGHVMDLLDQGVDHVFAPFAVSAKADADNPTANYNCPWVQTYPFMLKAALGDTVAAGKLLMPALHFRYFHRVLPHDLASFMGSAFGISPEAVLKALALADEAQGSFERAVLESGRRVLKNLPRDRVAAVVMGRPYNTGDPAMNLALVEKLIALNVLPIPQDFLPLEEERVLDDYYMMYWPNGRKILAAARIVARDERLNGVWLGNFRCGPDSFLQHYVRVEMAGKPFLLLEVDEHSADAGMITRCEAFLDSLKGWKAAHARSRQPVQPSVAGTSTPAIARAGSSVSVLAGAAAPGASPGRDRGEHGAAAGEPERIGARFRVRASGDSGRTLYFPYMNDGAHPLAAASRWCGVEAWVLPMQDEEDLRLARRHTSGKECFPMICTLGSFLKKMNETGFDPKRTAFFMPDHGGPCRFGQYNKLQRLVFDKLGYRDVEIIAPSNEDGYAGLSGGHGNRFRLTALKGITAFDLLRKLQQERRPYEAVSGETDLLYGECLKRIVRSVENGASDIVAVMGGIAEEFKSLRLKRTPRKPVIAVIGEIFMRDNAFCSGRVVERLEKFGGETLMAPFKEWLTYSTLRYGRDSRWKGDFRGLLRSRIQAFFTHRVFRMLDNPLRGMVELERDVDVEKMLELCGPYIHRDYDGDPALAMGVSAALAPTGISGITHILPFTCLPGACVAAVSGSFRKDHDNIPWVNVDFDGQEDTGIETRLQAFMHQAEEYCRGHGLDQPRDWTARAGAAQGTRLADSPAAAT